MPRKKRRVIIMGAAGRDFHNFNMFFRGNPNYDVIAFTATQVPGIANRIYPKELAGKGYPRGIPIYPEKQLSNLIKRNDVDEVVLAYSDLSHEYVMHKASEVLAAGADFKLMGPQTTMLKSKKPVISICGVRTGAGKSPTSRRVVRILRSLDKRVVVIRHPMPYCDLKKSMVQRFETQTDLEKVCTIEEREEYQPHIEAGTVVYAGVDYEEILKQAQKEADIIIWDGGNNDLPFLKPDLHIVVTDARRAGHEISYYPGETNFRMADVIIINKVDTANPKDIEKILKNIELRNPKATVIRTAMSRFVDKPELVKGKRVLVVEDGPTLTHGGMTFGAGTVIAKHLGAFLVSPRAHAVGSIKNIYVEYPSLGPVLPAMGYSKKQVQELEETINSTDCDTVIIGTPYDIREMMNLKKPAVRVRYEIREVTKPDLTDIIKKFLKK